MAIDLTVSLYIYTDISLIHFIKMATLPADKEEELLGVLSSTLQKVIEERPEAPVKSFAK